MLCKKVFLYILLSLCSCFTFSFERLDFTFESDVGLKNGRVDEIVYQDEKMISLLEWNVLLLPTINLKTNFTIKNFIFDCNCIFAIPTKLGNLKDYDFLSFETSGITHFSRHDLIVDNDFSFNFNIGYNFLEVNKFYLSSFLGFSYGNRKYTARDGYIEYTSKENLIGIVISYEQEIWYPFIKFDFTFVPSDFIETSFSTSIFPYIFANTLDSHFLRQVQFYDVMRGGFGVELNFSFVTKFSKDDIFFNLNVTYQYLHCKGNSFSNNIGIKNSNFILSKDCIAQMRCNFFMFDFGIVFYL